MPSPGLRGCSIPTNGGEGSGSAAERWQVRRAELSGAQALLRVLLSPQKLFNGEIPAELIRQHRTNEVIEVIRHDSVF